MSNKQDTRAVDSGFHFILPVGIARKGWHYENYTDLGEPSGVCEACGRPDIHYLHMLSHPQVPELVEVGFVCAEHLTTDYTTLQEQERRYKNLNARLRNFMQRTRRLSERGTYWMKYKGYLLWVYRHSDGMCGYAIDQRFRPQRFRTKQAAQQAAYVDIFGPKKHSVK